MTLRYNAKFIVLTIIVASSTSAENTPQLGMHPINEVIDAMTPEEKVHILLAPAMNLHRNPLEEEILNIILKPPLVRKNCCRHDKWDPVGRHWCFHKNHSRHNADKHR